MLSHTHCSRAWELQSLPLISEKQQTGACMSVRHPKIREGSLQTSSPRTRKFPKPFSLLIACFFLFFATLTRETRAQDLGIGEIELGEQLTSSNVEASTNVVSGLKTEGTSGQKIFRISFNSSAPLNDLTFSTCTSADFDTYIALLDGNPLDSKEYKILEENDNDRSCSPGAKRSTIEARIGPGTYYILITGNNGEKGSFTLLVDNQVPNSTPLPWGLDRIDQRSLPLDDRYTVNAGGGGVWVYILDSGIRATHEQFEGRASSGYDFVDLDDDASDCSGQGTHIAAAIGGKDFGVAKRVNLVSVRVLDCENIGRTSDVLNALEWVLIDVKIQGRLPAVVSLAVNTQQSSSLNAAMTTMNDAGIPVIVPAGNNASDACKYSPSSSSAAFTVGATNARDFMSSFSNFGSCTDLFSPGESINSAWHTGDFAMRNESGTTQAASLVSGIVSILLSVNEGLQPKELFAIMTSISTLSIIPNAPSAEPTRFAYVRSIPKVPEEVPGKGSIFIYFVLQFSQINSCLESSILEEIRSKMSNALNIEYKMLMQFCSNDEEQAGTEGRKITFQVREDERLSTDAFEHISKSILEERKTTEDILGKEFIVDEEPWVVDSKGHVYWAAPKFEEASKSSNLSAGKIAAIVVGVLAFLSLVAAILYIVYHQGRKSDLIQSMEGSADFETGPVVFEDPSKDNAPSRGGGGRSFRNIFVGLGRAVSFRRGQRGASSYSKNFGNGMNSFRGQPGSQHGQPPSGIVRMQSFGGEALAGIDTQSRANSFFTKRDSANSSTQQSGQRFASFRGRFNAVGNLGGSQRAQQEPEEIRIQSMGGEALMAIVGQSGIENSIDETPRFPREPFRTVANNSEEITADPAEESLGEQLCVETLDAPSAQAQDKSREEAELTSVSPRIETLANMSMPREPSFFGTDDE